MNRFSDIPLNRILSSSVCFPRSSTFFKDRMEEKKPTIYEWLQNRIGFKLVFETCNLFPMWKYEKSCLSWVIGEMETGVDIYYDPQDVASLLWTLFASAIKYGTWSKIIFKLIRGLEGFSPLWYAKEMSWFPIFWIALLIYW